MEASRKEKPHIGETIEIKWGVSRGRDTAGYTTASLYYQGKRVAACNGGGYDMRGTVVGNWITYAFSDELRALPLEAFPEESSWDGEKRVSVGRRLYGLTFHDPNYDPGKAVIGKDCADRTLTDDDQSGKTVEDAEAAGVSFGLERYQAFYSASSPVPTERHTVPSIDGACGFSSVMRILNALGYGLRGIVDRKNLDIYEVTEYQK